MTTMWRMTMIIIIAVRMSAVAPRNYEIERIEKNPGLYYERVGSLKIKKGDWKVTLFVELEDLLKVPDKEQEFEKAFASCNGTAMEYCCNFMLNGGITKTKRAQIKEELENVKDALSQFSTNSEGLYNPQPPFELNE